MRSVADLSRAIGGTADFEEQCRQRIQEYRRKAEELERERRSLRVSIRCDIGAGALSAVAGGSLAQIHMGVGIPVLLLACAFGLRKLKEYGPLHSALRTAEEEFRSNACYGLHQFFDRG
jgi:hypothetical protein